MHFCFLQALQIYQFAGQGDFLWFTTLARYIVILGVRSIEVFKESLSDTGTLFVDGVIGRVGNVTDAVPDISFHHTVANFLIYVKQFFAVVGQLFEWNALWMSQK